MRDLKDQLSKYLRRVRNGEVVTVTDRGKPVAMIVPVGLPAHIREMLIEGRATWWESATPGPLKKIDLPEGFSIVDFISEDRR